MFALNPFHYVAPELKVLLSLWSSLVEPFGARDETLFKSCMHLLSCSGKLLRPSLVLLFGYCALPEKDLHDIRFRDREAEYGRLPGPADFSPFHRQMRLAAVSELIHAASLMHDDIVDAAEIRRGQPSVHQVWGIPRTVLAGDFLLARASYWTATLGSHDVLQRVTKILEDLTTGEVIQYGGVTDQRLYMEKTYCKAASLLDNALASVAILSAGVDSPYVEAASSFGRHLGNALQIVDDCLDFQGESINLGKPSQHDMTTGVATLPMLLAAEKDTEVAQAILRRFSREGDSQRVMNAVQRYGTVEQAKSFAWEEYDKAISHLTRCVHPSEARSALEKVASYVVTRMH